MAPIWFKFDPNPRRQPSGTHLEQSTLNTNDKCPILDPEPQTTPPTSHTPRPTPHTPHPTPHIPHPAPCTLHPAPYTPPTFTLHSCQQCSGNAPCCRVPPMASPALQDDSHESADESLTLPTGRRVPRLLSNLSVSGCRACPDQASSCCKTCPVYSTLVQRLLEIKDTHRLRSLQ